MVATVTVRNTASVSEKGHSNADLARLSLLTVNMIVANLEKAGAISRRSHAVHGRIQQLELTKQGQRVLAEAKTRMLVLEGELIQGLPAEKERIIRRWLVGVATDQPNA